VAEIPAAPATDDAPAVQTLLDDNQSRLTSEGEAYYNRRVRKILRPEGLLGLTSLGFTWKPETDSVTFHTLRIIRNGKAIDLLGSGRKMLVLRREKNLERAALDGRITASQQLEDVQVGDVLDFAYTYTSKDPILKGRAYDTEALGFPGVAARYRVRISWPKDESFDWKATPGFGQPAVTERGGWRWLELDTANAKAPDPPVGAPLRFRRLGSLEVSSFGSWRDVSQLMWPHYQAAAKLSADSPLRTEVRAIIAQSKDPKNQAFLALQLVEEKTRYFFLGVGQGGYVPASADDTWARKLGDCKAKSVLLIALLHELGISAEPVLVNMGGGDGLDERPASVAAFNHVLVRATIDGRAYWLDGTRTGDRSGLSALRPPDYRWALPLRDGGADLERIVIPTLVEPQVDAKMRLDASGGLDAPAPVEITVRMHGDLATATRQMIAVVPKADLERSWRQASSAQMSWIDVKTIDWRDDADHDAFEFHMSGTAIMDWRRNPDVRLREYKVTASTAHPSGFPKREPGPNRDAPFAVPFPMFVRAVTEIVLPDAGRGFTIRGPNGVEKVAGIELQRTSALQGGVARFEVESRSVTQEITAAEAEAATLALRRMAADESLVRAPN
jgi:transglutaminase-like putative cysteine protease